MTTVPAAKVSPRAKPKPQIKKRPILRHGQSAIEVPELSAPVGRPAAELLQRFPAMNNPADVAVVDYYLSHLKEIGYLVSTKRSAPYLAGLGSLVASLFESLGSISDWDNRNSNISTLQRKLGVKDQEEVKYGLIKPDGETLMALVDYGDQAEKLLAAKNANGRLSIKDYIHGGYFNQVSFLQAVQDSLSKSPRYSVAAIPDMNKLLNFMAADPAILDIRWMAYMLATVFWETTSPMVEKIPVLKKNGMPLTDKVGKPVMRTNKKWVMTMAPVDEVGHGKGRAYYLPVKVKKLPNGTVCVTEQDGDQFTVSNNGKYAAINRGAKRGSAAAEKVTDVYTNENGDEYSYYGRGYVQLTWWNNYASAGVAIGKGLELLLNPENVKDPATAYSIMSHGMRTGHGFANGKRFSQFFYGTYTDYVGARKMVNGGDHKDEIAAIAKTFESILMKAKT